MDTSKPRDSVQYQIDRFLEQNRGHISFCRPFIIEKRLAKYLNDNEIVYAKTESAILSALKRSLERIDNAEIKSHVVDVIRRVQINVQSGTNKMIIKKDDTIFAKLASFIRTHTPFVDGLRVIDGGNKAIILAQKKIADELITHFDGEVIKKNVNLGEITLTIPEEVTEVEGVYQALLSVLTSNGININEAVTCQGDYHILVKDEDLAKSTNLFFEVIKESQRLHKIQNKQPKKIIQKQQ